MQTQASFTLFHLNVCSSHFSLISILLLFIIFNCVSSKNLPYASSCLPFPPNRWYNHLFFTLLFILTFAPLTASSSQSFFPSLPSLSSLTIPYASPCSPYASSRRSQHPSFFSYLLTFGILTSPYISVPLLFIIPDSISLRLFLCFSLLPFYTQSQEYPSSICFTFSTFAILPPLSSLFSFKFFIIPDSPKLSLCFPFPPFFTQSREYSFPFLLFQHLLSLIHSNSCSLSSSPSFLTPENFPYASLSFLSLPNDGHILFLFPFFFLFNICYLAPLSFQSCFSSSFLSAYISALNFSYALLSFLLHSNASSSFLSTYISP